MTTETVYDILKAFDRMPDNPDNGRIRQLSEQAHKEGVLDLLVFVCPKFNTAALLSSTPEEYMPTDANDPNDLFFQRIPMLQKVLAKAGSLDLKVKLSVLLGDNDAEVYIFPFVRGFCINLLEFDRRRKLYLESFQRRAASLFAEAAQVRSLSMCEVIPNKQKQPVIKEDEFRDELAFFSWLFGEKGPYKGKLQFDEATLREMVRLKFALYGAQGTFLETIGGVLLQTEGPGVWLQRTQMLRCTGAKAVPAIYPWIRKDEKH